MRDLELARRPFYAERLEGREVRPWDLDDLEDFARRTGDPFAGRLLPAEGPPPLSLQLEACDDPPLWAGLDGRELAAFARVLAGIWSRYGVERGQCVALFDYGSSPGVLLASASYAPHLRRGAAELLGLSVVCNDGVASLAERMVEILERIRPAALMLRADVLAPFAEVLGRAGVRLGDVCRWAAVTDAERIPPPDLEEASEALGIRLEPLLRLDAAFLLAGGCRLCRAFHLDARAYRVESLGSEGVAVTARFARTCAAARHRLEGAELLGPGCAREPRATRIRWA